jgi:hypothetical protein
MKKRQAFVEIRSQHSRGSSSNTFGGPDTYVTVQIVPEGQTRLRCLNYKHAKKRNIRLLYCGEGYSKNQATERSMLGAAIKKAEDLANDINDLSNKWWWSKL